ncbi:NAD(P)-binding domain-containing protein [Nocardia paucivorans]|uniref:NAD(P)-binding domain-containing protein n=1 Tax=Nocardia paucivorans TaxID=114259 RepID=UPI0002E44450|nr:NAD(P)-binding domain-containing protein [Nocardia paucivorans]
MAIPNGEARAGWAQTLVVDTATVAPEVVTALADTHGDRFVDAPILGTPQELRSGTAGFAVGGPAAARMALAPVWQGFAGAFDAGDSPQRAAGVDDAGPAATLRTSPLMAAGLSNRIDGFFDPTHAGWFTSTQAAKDVTSASRPAEGDIPLPVTEAARDTYRQPARDGWETAGRHRPCRIRTAARHRNEVSGPLRGWIPEVHVGRHGRNTTAIPYSVCIRRCIQRIR